MPCEAVKKNKSSDFLQADEHSNNNKDVTPLDLCRFYDFIPPLTISC